MVALLSRPMPGLLPGPLLAQRAGAQTAPATQTPFDTVVVNGLRTPARIDETLADTTVIDRAQIEQATGFTLAALLSLQAGCGVLVVRRCGQGQPGGDARPAVEPHAVADQRRALQIGHHRRAGLEEHPARRHRAHRDRARAVVARCACARTARCVAAACETPTMRKLISGGALRNRQARGIAGCGLRQFLDAPGRLLQQVAAACVRATRMLAGIGMRVAPCA